MPHQIERKLAFQPHALNDLTRQELGFVHLPGRCSKIATRCRSLSERGLVQQPLQGRIPWVPERASDLWVQGWSRAAEGGATAPVARRGCTETVQAKPGVTKMTGKRKSAGRAGRSEADLGQKEAGLEKTQAELENASETQLSHM